MGTRNPSVCSGCNTSTVYTGDGSCVSKSDEVVIDDAECPIVSHIGNAGGISKENGVIVDDVFSTEIDVLGKKLLEGSKLGDDGGIDLMEDFSGIEFPGKKKLFAENNHVSPLKSGNASAYCVVIDDDQVCADVFTKKSGEDVPETSRNNQKKKKKGTKSGKVLTKPDVAPSGSKLVPASTGGPSVLQPLGDVKVLEQSKGNRVKKASEEMKGKVKTKAWDKKLNYYVRLLEKEFPQYLEDEERKERLQKEEEERLLNGQLILHVKKKKKTKIILK